MPEAFRSDRLQRRRPSGYDGAKVAASGLATRSEPSGRRPEAQANPRAGGRARRLFAPLLLAGTLFGPSLSGCTQAPEFDPAVIPTVSIEGRDGDDASSGVGDGAGAAETAPNPPTSGSSVTEGGDSAPGSGTDGTAASAPSGRPGGSEGRGTATAFRPVEGLEVVLDSVGEGFVKPVDLADPSGAGQSAGGLWIVEQGGTVRRLVDGRPGEPPVLDIRDRVEDGANEQGLLGIALHPDYPRNGRFFVNYTGVDDATVIAEFGVRADQDRLAPLVDPGTERIILRIDQPARNHNGGQIAFGPDGYLYVGMGDGGGANDVYGNAQDPTSLLGKMLRIDVDTDGASAYEIPPDNPFLDSTSFRPEIWAWGLRNPWRFSFDTGDDGMAGLYIGDVGQGSWEEIDWVPLDGGGANFGWPILEGTHCFMALGQRCDPDGATLRPIAEYPQGGGNGCSVTGGRVIRTPGSPLAGAYLFGDYCSGRLWIAWRDAGGQWRSQVVADTGLRISAFGGDGGGGEYLLSHASGEVFRIVGTAP